MQTAFSTQQHPRRGRAGCFLGCLSALLVLLVIVGGLWFLAVRPYLHNIATNELEQTLSSATNQIPASAQQLPPGPILIQEKALNNLIALNIAPSSPIQHAQSHITTSNIEFDFQAYGFPCTITGIPQASNGQLVMTNVSVQGPIALIMSADELTALLNKHLADAQQRIHHTILAVQLKNQELGLLLG